MRTANIEIDEEAIAAFCRKWKVREFSLFGSVIRDDFRPDSDVDVLVSLEENSGIGLWEMSDMLDELEEMFGRKVDLVEKDGLRNPFRRHAILNGREVIYTA